jgi:hypothetical protein
VPIVFPITQQSDNFTTGILGFNFPQSVLGQTVTSFAAVDAYPPAQYIQQWSASVQKSAGRNTNIEVGYQGEPTRCRAASRSRFGCSATPPTRQQCWEGIPSGSTGQPVRETTQFGTTTEAPDAGLPSAQPAPRAAAHCTHIGLELVKKAVLEVPEVGG